MFFKDFVSVKRKKIKKGASQTYDTPSSSYIVIETYALKLSKSSAWKFWMYAE